MGKKNIVILGTSGFAKEVAFLIQRINMVEDCWNIMGFLDNNEEKGKIIMGYPVLGNDDWLKKYEGAIYVVCGIGSSKVRKKVVSQFLGKKNIFFPNLIDPSVIVSADIKIGKGNVICAGTIITVDVVLHDFVTINLDCTIGHDAELEEFVTLCPSVNVSGNVFIEEEAEIGTGTQIIQGIQIEKKAIVGAGAVVIRDVKQGSTVVGNPARQIK